MKRKNKEREREIRQVWGVYEGNTSGGIPVPGEPRDIEAPSNGPQAYKGGLTGHIGQKGSGVSYCQPIATSGPYYIITTYIII